MGPSLSEGWLEGLDAAAVVDEASVSLARRAVRERGAEAGLDRTRTEAMAVVASELVRNQLRHARRGRVAVRLVRRGDTRGVEIVCTDEGAGIADPSRAFREKARPHGSLGAGLAAVLRLADETDFDVRLGEGTCVRARKFVSPLRRREIAVFGRPLQGERVSGDEAAVVTLEDALVVAVADGLGHGPPAREASALAMSVFRREAARSAEEILALCDHDLRGTRGAVMSIVRIEGERIVHAGVGNTQIHLYAQDRSRTVRFTGAPGVIGRRRGTRLRTEEAPLPERHLLVAFTDGLSSRLEAAGDPDPFLVPPLAAAQHLLERFGKPHDDALILVAR